MRIEGQSDAEIIKASLKNPELFAELFERHYRVLYRLLSAAVGDSEGEELASEVFARAFAQRQRYDVEYGDARPWLYGIAANLIRSYYRDHSRRMAAYRRELGRTASTVEFEEDTVERIAASSQRPILARALGQLRREEAQVLVLHVIGELSNVEIAVAIGSREATVRSRLSRARSKLKSSMYLGSQWP